jgi:hypothetical protein
MSKVIAGFSMSLDGSVADPDDGVDRVFKWYWAGGTDAKVVAGDGTFEMSREGAEFIEEAGKGAAVLLTVRRTFDLAQFSEQAVLVREARCLCPLRSRDRPLDTASGAVREMPGGGGGS